MTDTPLTDQQPPRQCGPACNERHTYDGCCQLGPSADRECPLPTASCRDRGCTAVAAKPCPPLTDRQLADRIAAELPRHYAITPNNDGTVICSCGDRVKVDHQRQAFREHTAAAVVAVVQPEVDRLRAENTALDDLRLRAIDRGEKLRAELAGRRTEDLTLRGLLVPADGTRRVPMALGDSVAPAVEWLIAELATARAAAFGEAAALLRAAQAEAESAELERHSYLDHETQLQHDAVHWAADLLLAARSAPDAR